MRQLPFVILALVVAAGCGKPASQRAQADGQAAPVDRSGILATADSADGTVDHVVSKCAVCGLGMDGSPSHASTHAGYEFHLCSSDCKETFDRDPEQVIARLAKRST